MPKKQDLKPKPFIDTVNGREFPAISSGKVAPAPEKTIQEANGNRTLDELKKSLSEIRSKTEQFVFACNNGTDDMSYEMLSDLLAENKIKLDKISDKNNGNCSLLHSLAKRNKVNTMELLCAQKVKIDCADSMGATPLMYAVVHNHQEAAALLLYKGANINARDMYSKFPLMIALKNHYYTLLEQVLLSNQKIDVHQRGAKGVSALHVAAESGDLRGVQLLMKHGASAQRRNNDEENVLVFGLAHPEITQHICHNTDKKTLLKMTTNQSVRGTTIVHDCAKNGYIDSLIIILKSLEVYELTSTVVDDLINLADKNGDTPLLLAVKSSSKSVVKFLCECTEIKANEADKDGNTAMFHAAALKDSTLIEMLSSIGGSLKAANAKEDTKGNPFFDWFRSMKNVLVMILSLVAFISIIVIAAIMIGFFGGSVSHTLRTVRQQYFDDVMNHVSRIVDEVTLTSDTIEAQISKNPLFNITNEPECRQLTWRAMYTATQRMPVMTGVYCGDGYYGCGFMPQGGDFGDALYYFDWSFKLHYRTRYGPVPAENRADLMPYVNVSTGVTSYRSTVDINLAYVKAAKNAKASVWTLSYTSKAFPNMLFLTISHAIRKQNGDFGGFCAYDGTTETLNKLLRTKALQQHSVIAVIERSTGYLIGSSDETVQIYEFDKKNGTTRTDGRRSDNQRMASMLTYAQAHHGGFNYSSVGTDKLVYDTFSFNGEKNILNIGRLTDPYGLDWVIVQSFPQSLFYKQFYNSIIIMCCVTVGLLIAGVILSIVVAYIFMRPLKKLIQQAEEIRMLQLEQVEKTLKSGLSYFTEVNHLQQSIYSMTIRLKQFKSFIPDHILAVVEAEVGATKERNEAKKLNDKSSEEFTTTESVTESRRGGARSGNMIVNALNSSLTSGAVTVMTVEFPDFRDVMELHNSADVAEAVKELLSSFKDIISISKGQFVSITSQRAEIVWNTFIKQSDHCARASKTARQCVEVLQKLQKQWKEKNMPELQVAIALASGNCHYGNLGTDSMKFFSLIGLPATRSNKMCKLASKWRGVSVFCDENVHVTLKEEFNMRPLDRLDDKQTGSSTIVYQLGEIRPGDGWVVEMQEKDKISPWNDFSDAFELYDRGLYEEAHDKLVAFTSVHSEDQVALKLLDICKLNKEDATTDNTGTVVDNPDVLTQTLNE
jgi:ankyrin repeat protein/class 3 adenylate cyclase